MRIINKFQWGGGLQALIEQSRNPKSVYSYAFNQAETLPLYQRDATLPEVTVSVVILDVETGVDKLLLL